MATKSAQGQTKKYSNVVKSVQNAQPEEKKITPEQVVAAFKSFGIPINDRQHNDIAVWTMRGVSEGHKLIEELSKRRKEINDKEDEDKKTQEDRQKANQKAEDDKKAAQETVQNKQHVDKAAMPRLSDSDIAALYDEYGLPPQDPEWSRNHLPNDPKMIRNILSMQRKFADDMMKKHTKNTVNSMPEVPKATSAPVMPMGRAMNGQGGPTPNSPMGMQDGMTPGDAPVKPFFVGDHALIKITNPQNPNSGTLWLVDKQKKSCVQ